MSSYRFSSWVIDPASGAWLVIINYLIGPDCPLPSVALQCSVVSLNASRIYIFIFIFSPYMCLSPKSFWMTSISSIVLIDLHTVLHIDYKKLQHYVLFYIGSKLPCNSATYTPKTTHHLSVLQAPDFYQSISLIQNHEKNTKCSTVIQMVRMWKAKDIYKYVCDISICEVN